MSIRKVSEGVSQWNNKMPFPKDRYTLLVTEEEFGASSGGNPMITRTLEIVAPETAKIGDIEMSVVGSKVYQYLICKVSDGDGGWDTEKSDKAYGRLRDDLLVFDPSLTEIDDEAPPLIAKGKYVSAIVYGKENKSFKAPTPEQLAKGAKVGDAIKGTDGKDIVVYQLQLEGGILAVVEKPGNMAF